MQFQKGFSIAVVIPCYRCKAQILKVISAIGPEVGRIYVVDDACPDETGRWVQMNCGDPRVAVLRNPENTGVGGAVLRGYAEAFANQFDIIVKIDGDGQMNPKLIREFVAPIVAGRADYTKGNRFMKIESAQSMPLIRKLGNIILSFTTKLSSGYWSIFDPTNGYTAIHKTAFSQLPPEKISRRYFFESDILFRLRIIRAVVKDIPMQAIYQDEESHLKIKKIIFEFAFKNIRNFLKRIFYQYFLLDFRHASIDLIVGTGLLTFGSLYGGYHWLSGQISGIANPTGVVVMSSLFIALGVQLLLNFLNYDTQSEPKEPLIRDAQDLESLNEKILSYEDNQV
jgi:dolichol-phosphate mannosyltransferase